MGISQLILTIAKTVGVPGSLLLAICTHESNLINVAVIHDHGSPSYGLCQIKEDTARALGYRGIASGPLQDTDLMPDSMVPKGEPQGLMKPSINVQYAALYLKMQLERYDSDWCMATSAYNAGSYNESVKEPGHPKNYKYIKQIVLLLNEDYKDYLVCGARRLETK